MRGLIYFIFPLIELLESNKKINKQIEKIENDDNNEELDYVGNTKSYKLNQINIFYKQSIKDKDILEEKAKLSIVSITILVTMMIFFSNIILKIDFNSLTIFEKCLFYTILSLILFYINVSAWLSLKAIGDKNKVYRLTPTQYKTYTDIQKSQYLAIITELNTKLNIIRQNFVYSSYRHLIYAIILLSFLFLSIIFLVKNDKKIDKEIIPIQKTNYNKLCKDMEKKLNNLLQKNNIEIDSLNQLKKTIDKTNEKIDNLSLEIDSCYNTLNLK